MSRSETDASATGDRSPACPNIDALEVLVREGAPPVPDAIAAHIDSCIRCRDLLNEMRSANAFLARFSSAAGHTRSRPDHQPEVPGARVIRVPGYEVERLIAYGGQGAVYKARQKGTGRHVAIKVPLGDTHRRPSTRVRFQREIELTARLEHPGIVRVFGDCELDDGRIGCVMEFVEGVPIDRWASLERPNGRPGLRRIVEVMSAVADAIAYAHLRAVMHRDIKPSNVVVTPEGGPRVLDFGLAKALNESGRSLSTLTGAFVGTLAYAAPEQISAGPDASDLRTDVYALGLLLFQALTGRLPHATDAPAMEILHHIHEVSAPTPSKLNPLVGAELDAVVLKALAKEKDRRYASAAELRDDLTRWLAGDAVSARRDSTWYIVRKAIARRKRLVAGAAVVTLSAAAGLAVSAYNIATAGAAREREEYERSRAAGEVTRADAVQQILDELIPVSEVSPEGGAEAAARRNLDLLDAKLEAGLLRGQPLVEAAVRSLLGSTYADRGSLAQAEVQYRQALHLRLTELGSSRPETAQASNQLAEVLLRRGKIEEARLRARTAFDARAEALGARHPDVAESLDTLARIELALGHTDEAALDAGRARAILQSAPDADRSLVATNLSLLADIAAAEGRADDAVSLAREALVLHLRDSTDEHPNVIHALDGLAQFERSAGDDANAALDQALAAGMSSTRSADRPVETWSRLVDLKRRLLGPEDPEIVQSLTFMGIAQEQAGDLAGAVDTHRQALAILERTDGPDSLAVADCSVHLVGPLKRLGRFDEMLAELQRRYEIYRRRLIGRNDLGIVVAHREWAGSFAEVLRDDDAIRELESTLVEIRDLCHSDPYEISRVQLSIAEIHAARAEDDQAESLARQALDLPPAILRQAVTERRRASFVLAAVLASRDDFETATTLLDDFADLLLLARPNQFGANCVWRRIALRTSAAFQRSPAPEPASLAAIRQMFNVPAPPQP